SYRLATRRKSIRAVRVRLLWCISIPGPDAWRPSDKQHSYERFLSLMFSPLIDELMSALRCLPGVGPKSAQRMTLHLLERDRAGAERLAQSLQKAVDGVG